MQSCGEAKVDGSVKTGTIGKTLQGAVIPAQDRHRKGGGGIFLF